MSVPAAFIGVVLIWATTPLAIKWSSEDAGFLFGVTSRMLLGVFVCLILVAILNRRMRWDRAALQTYLAAGLGVWGAMSSVYWSAQYIPSGLISVLFGLTPLLTGVMAALWLGERSLTASRLIGIGLGILGLGIIFVHSTELGENALWGVLGVLLSVSIHSLSSVGVKYFGTSLPGLETTTGALLIAVPLFVLVWGVFDGELPTQLSQRALGSIVYLGIVGSVLGFILYYHLLRQMQASRVALITLMTPILALFIGQEVNAEVIGSRTWIGTGFILIGLACFQFGERIRFNLSRVAKG